jgi:potassium-transporting ATPase KdpC subunit
MKNHIVVSLRITLALLVITCGIYPALVWAVGQIAFRHQANGSLVTRNGRVIGSELIGQRFDGDRYFHSRPSAVDYDGSNSGGSNLGPTSKKLRDRIAADVKAAGGGTSLPADAVTTSASGLDPHISPAYALLQAPRVARANHLPLDRVRAMINARTEERFIGVFGEPRINVLLLNLDLMAQRNSGA